MKKIKKISLLLASVSTTLLIPTISSACNKNDDQKQNDKPADTGTTEKPKDPVKPDKPVTPEQPKDPDKPVTPEKPKDPDKPDKPVTPEKPKDPDKPVTPDPVTPSEPPFEIPKEHKELIDKATKRINELIEVAKTRIIPDEIVAFLDGKISPETVYKFLLEKGLLDPSKKAIVDAVLNALPMLTHNIVQLPNVASKLIPYDTIKDWSKKPDDLKTDGLKNEIQKEFYLMTVNNPYIFLTPFIINDPTNIVYELTPLIKDRKYKEVKEKITSYTDPNMKLILKWNKYLTTPVEDTSAIMSSLVTNKPVGIAFSNIKKLTEKTFLSSEEIQSIKNDKFAKLRNQSTRVIDLLALEGKAKTTKWTKNDFAFFTNLSLISTGLSAKKSIYSQYWINT